MTRRSEALVANLSPLLTEVSMNPGTTEMGYSVLSQRGRHPY
jgi:hypothetical protein